MDLFAFSCFVNCTLLDCFRFGYLVGLELVRFCLRVALGVLLVIVHVAGDFGGFVFGALWFCGLMVLSLGC